MAETFLSLRDVVVRYGATKALDIQTLEVKRGEVLAVLGANGAGKSTLLRVMGLLQNVDLGFVEFPGLAALCRSRLALRRRVAAVFQEPLLIDDSVYGNVALGLRLRGVAKAELDNRVSPWLERLGVRHLAQRSARTLSGGEAQRVSLARALVLNPDLLLLDEPFAALDPASREALLRDLHRTLKGLGVTVVLVTHDRHEAFALAQQVAVLDRGRMVQLGSRKEIFNHPVNSIVAAIVGFENRLSGIVEFADGALSRIAIGGESVAIPGSYIVGSKVVLCIRASAVALSGDTPHRLGPLKFSGNVRDVFNDQNVSQFVVNCAGFSLAASVPSTCGQPLGLREGSDVMVSLEPDAIHVIVEEDSH